MLLAVPCPHGQANAGAKETTNKVDKHSTKLASGVVCLVGRSLLRTQTEDSETTQVQYLSGPFAYGSSF